MFKNISIVFILFSLTACAQFDGSFLDSSDPMTEQLSNDVTPEVTPVSYTHLTLPTKA